MWCVGVLLVEMLFGELPFKSSNGPERDYSEIILSLKFTLPQNKGVSEDAQDLVRKLLVK